MRSETIQFFEGGRSIRSRVNEIAIGLQAILQDLSNVGIIIDYEEVL